ncbi:hypothetical protein [Paraglaciecola sp.]|uniref:serine O-acetyltransferase n=1 Tax=Paraglaciecola sp. TaxID=1920173 RepID=UPI003267D61A
MIQPLSIKNLIKTDLYRYSSDCSFSSFAKLFLKNSYFRFQVYLRLAKVNNRFFASLFKLLKARLGKKVNVQLSPKVPIGYGLYIPHGNIVVNAKTVIGNNCSLLQFASIGAINNGKAANVGNNVYIGPNSNIVGDIAIGDNSVIGAGAVVVKNVDNNEVVAGIPAKLIKKVIEINDYSENLCPIELVSEMNK